MKKYLLGVLTLTSTLLTFTTIMRPISTAKCSSVLSLLGQGYSHHQIHNDTGVGMGTIGKEIDSQKENNPGGHPSKLYACDK